MKVIKLIALAALMSASTCVTSVRAEACECPAETECPAECCATACPCPDSKEKSVEVEATVEKREEVEVEGAE